MGRKAKASAAPRFAWNTQNGRLVQSHLIRAILDNYNVVNFRNVTNPGRFKSVKELLFYVVQKQSDLPPGYVLPSIDQLDRRFQALKTAVNRYTEGLTADLLKLVPDKDERVVLLHGLPRIFRSVLMCPEGERDLLTGTAAMPLSFEQVDLGPEISQVDILRAFHGQLTCETPAPGAAPPPNRPLDQRDAAQVLETALREVAPSTPPSLADTVIVGGVALPPNVAAGLRLRSTLERVYVGMRTPLQSPPMRRRRRRGPR